MIHSNFIEANGLRLHYFRQPADKPTLLLLHGLVGAASNWMPVIEALNLNNSYDIVAPDARGHGQSDAPAHGYSPTDHAADAAALIHALGLTKPIVIGHSMGGMQATVLTAHHPELVHALVLEDPAWLDLSQQPTPDFRKQMAAEWLRDLEANQALTRDALIAKGHTNNPQWSDAELQAWSASQYQVRPQVLEYIEHAPMDWRGLLSKFACPTLLITGDTSRGVIITPEQAREAQSLNSRLQVAHVPNAAHNIRRDNFADYMAAVRAFLEKL